VSARPNFPWCAVVGQERLRLALTLCAIDPSLGGVLIHGPRGVAKTTLARALGELVAGEFVELPLGASEESVTGTLDLEAALSERRVAFAPGLLARAHEGVLYVDEVNLLADHLVDLLLDAAASGVNVVERDGISHAHPARFVLIGSMNPDEGELRPQLLDRFGLSVSASSELSQEQRAEILTRRLEFESDPEAFRARYASEQQAWAQGCAAARDRLARMPLDRASADRVAKRCAEAHVEGVRADLALLRAARAHAAWEGRAQVDERDLDLVEEFALEHRRSSPSPPRDPGTGGAPAGSHGTGSGRPPRPSEPTSGTPRGRGSEASPTTQKPESSRSFGLADRGAEPTTSHRENPETSPLRNPEAAPPEPRSEQAGHASPSLVPVPPSDSGRVTTRSLAAHVLNRRPRFAAPIPEARKRARSPRALPSGRAQRHAETSEHRSIDWFATLSRTRADGRTDLRYRVRHAPERALTMIALDCSASMLRGAALAEAKRLAFALEYEARERGAHTALLSFRGAEAHVEVAPRSAPGKLRRRVAELGAGGATPLRVVLGVAAEMVAERAWRSARVAKQLILLTDGRTREAVADLREGFEQLGLELLLVDCERGFVRLGRTPELAQQLGAACTSLDALLRESSA